MTILCISGVHFVPFPFLLYAFVVSLFHFLHAAVCDFNGCFCNLRAFFVTADVSEVLGDSVVICCVSLSAQTRFFC